MSRGLGKWQRFIMEAIEDAGWCVVCELLPEDAKRSEITALNRAVHSLAKRGAVEVQCRTRPQAKVKWTPWGFESHPDRTVLVCVRPGFRAPKWLSSLPLCQGKGEWVPWSVWNKLHYVRTREERDQVWADYKSRPSAAGGTASTLIEPQGEKEQARTKAEAYAAHERIMRLAATR